LIGQDIIKAADFIIDLSDEPHQDPQAAKPEQEEVKSNSIAQLGDNPLATSEPDNASTEGELTLACIRQQIVDLLAAVDKLMK
jgi:hypothetical protein